MMQKSAFRDAVVKKPSGISTFFTRMLDSARLVFRKKAGLGAEAEKKVKDADSLIAKADDYEAGRALYARAIKLLNAAKLKSAKPSEKTHELLADAYLGLAVCKWENGENEMPDLKKAIEHARAALLLNGSNQNARATCKEAAKRMK